MKTIKLKAVENRMLPIRGGRGFVGYRPAAPAEQADYEVPGGHRYALDAEPREYPDTVYYRRALLRGDVAFADDRPKKVAARKEEG